MMAPPIIKAKSWCHTHRRVVLQDLARGKIGSRIVCEPEVHSNGFERKIQQDRIRLAA